MKGVQPIAQIFSNLTFCSEYAHEQKTNYPQCFVQMFHAYIGQMIDSLWMIKERQGRYVSDLYDI